MHNRLSLYKECFQCPRKCGADRTGKKTGACGEGESIRIASACLHFGEEPPVTVYGGSGTVFFTGCTLKCAFCQNYQIAQQGMGREVSSDEFISICLRLQDAGAENINLVTASHCIPKLAEYLRGARRAGLTIPFCWNSSAYENVEMLELLRGTVTVWLPDLKTLSAALAGRLFAAEDYPQTAVKAILWMMEASPLKLVEKNSDGKTKEKIQSGVIIRHLFLPGRFEETADTLDWLKHNADKKAVISLMSQYTPVPFAGAEDELLKRKASLSAIENRLVTAEEDQDLKDLIEAYDFEYLFYQELSNDTSWLPDFKCVQPFSNELARPFWHWKTGFCV
ncbi:radical SAM protein [Treponema parvum]|nr:radical SAM protein [Treponema parvum]QTQ15276.1 radical SAM protein [Treponema parvum]